MKKIACMLGACMLLSLLLAACAGRGSEPGTPDAPGVPEAAGATPEEELGGELLVCVDSLLGAEGVVGRFISKHSGLAVEVEYIPGHESELEREAFFTSLRTRILAGKEPDVLFLSSSASYYGALFADEDKAMATGMLEDLNNWLPEETLAGLHPVVLGAGQYEGAQYLMPVDYELDGLLFSTASMPRAEGLLAGVETAGDFAAVLPGLYAMYDDPWRVTFDITKEIKAGMVDYAAMTTSFDHDALAALMEANKRSMEIETDSLPSGVYYADGKDSPLIPYAESYVCFGVSPSLFRIVAPSFKQADERVVPFVPPNSGGGYTAVVYNYAAIPANSNNKPAAASFIELLLDPVYQSTIESIGGRMGWLHGMPVRLGCLQPLYTEVGAKSEALEALLAIEQGVTTACFLPREFRGIVEEQEERFYRGEITAYEALAEIERKLTTYF